MDPALHPLAGVTGVDDSRMAGIVIQVDVSERRVVIE